MSGPTVFGKYRLLERLAEGGMAEVYKAVSQGVEGFEKHLIIKRILPEFAQHQDFIDMFIDEAKIAVALSHANIVQVLDLGEAEGSYFMAMEYVPGVDLATLLRRRRQQKKPLPCSLCVFVAAEVAKALDYAHRRRDDQQRPLHVVHRDVSPHNILLSTEGEVKLTDFGIAHAQLAAGPRRHTLGKYAYMSPEQARGDRVDGRADLFSLGTVLYECLSGVRPFESDTPGETLRRVRTGLCEPLNRVAPHLPDQLCETVHRAMAPKPEDRHTDAGQLFEALTQALYAMGQHLTGKDVAAHVTDVRPAGSPPSGSPLDIRQPSNEAPETTRPRARDATPVHVPHRLRRGTHPPVSEKNGPSAHAQAEGRDVSVISLGPWQSETLPASILTHFHQHGATLATDVPTDGWWHIATGLVDAGGCDTEDAMRLFLELRTGMLDADTGTPHLQAGLHSARVLVTADGSLVDDEHLSKLLLNATHAAKLSKPGQLLVSADAERIGRRQFSLRCSKSSDHWTLVNERQQLEPQNQFVGRKKQLRRLGELLAKTSRGEPQVVALVGDKGSGKSRLMQEAVRRLVRSQHDVGVHLAQVPRRAKSTPYAMLRQLMRSVLGIGPLEAEAQVRLKTDQAVRGMGLSEAEQAAVKSVVDLHADVTRLEQTQGLPVSSAVAAVARKIAQDRLTIFAFDGIENADPHSLRVLFHLLSTQNLPNIAVILLHAPGVLGRWATLPNYVAIGLDPMPHQTATRLATSRLGAQSVPAEVLREIVERSEGNPLHIEAYIRALRDENPVEVGRHGKLDSQDSSIVDLDVPRTIRRLVSARLSRLSPPSRHLVQIAAVIGRRVHAGVVSIVSGRHPEEVATLLQDLQTAEVVKCFANDECGLHRPVIGDVVRSGLTDSSRQALHLAVAEALVTFYEGKLDEWADTIAGHFHNGGAPDRAIEFHIRSANRHQGQGALVAAVDQLETALDRMSFNPTRDRELRLRLYTRFGNLCIRSRQQDRGATMMVAALDFADGLGRDDYAARFCALRGTLLSQRHRLEEAREWIARSQELARPDGTPEVLRDVLMATAEAETAAGNFRDAIGPLERAMAMTATLVDSQSHVRCLSALAVAYAASGRTADADRALARATSASGKGRDTYTECALLEASAHVHRYGNRPDLAASSAAQALELAKAHHH